MGVAAALASATIWAYASARYASASRTVGAARVNLARMLVVLPMFLVAAFLLHRTQMLRGLDGARAAWLAASVVCSYGVGDVVFFTATRRLGISTALSIASIYPLWSALAGRLLRDEPLTVSRVAGVLLCVAGVVWLVQLTTIDEPHRRDLRGVVLSLLTSLLWAGNGVCVKQGAVGLSLFEVNSYRFAVALPILLVLARGAPRVPYRSLVPTFVLDAFVGSCLFIYAFQHTDLAVAATLSSLAPLLSLPIAIALGDERWNARRFAAIAVTVAGAILLVATA